ncbi:hypothetical protein JKP88DRAFT_347589 [Tribonema minus]|uniref:Glycosyl transferase family 25 domain-containing protein n=1 Tax=Tribonema minus TaxID=303371 RepID=A0A835Z9V1_9STRA|nr:hypothetical protein JKP88DRAFT_347589 [Tribonema minus]
MVPMTASERACAASHLALWKRLADGDLEPFKCNSTKRDMALILEDDALLSPYFVQRINMLLQHPDMAGMDLCFIGYSLPGAVRHKVKQALEQLKDDSRASQAKRGVKHGPTPMHVDFCWQAHAYLLSREGAKRLTARKPHESLIDAPVDITMATRMKSKRIAAMACHPALADQSHEYTDIVDVKSNAIQRVDTRGGAILQYL